MTNENAINYTLLLPSIKYKDSFLELVTEAQADEGSLVLNSEENLDLKQLKDDQYFEAYLAQLRNEARGIALPDGYLPHSTFWLIEQENDCNNLVGRVDIRHSLNKSLLNFGGHIGYLIRPSYRGMGLGTKILCLALEKAKKIIQDSAIYGSQILLTTNVSNLASQKVIEKNGGELEKITSPALNEADMMFYWIKI